MALVWQICRQTLDNNESLDIWKHKISQALDQEDLLIGQANCTTHTIVAKEMVVFCASIAPNCSKPRKTHIVAKV